MNIYFVAAALLIIILGAIHSILGEKLIINPVLKLDLPHILGSDFITKRTLRFAWHLTTIIWWASAIILFYLAFHTIDPITEIIVKIFSVAYLFSGLVSLVIARGKHFSWYVCLVISIALWLGS